MAKIWIGIVSILALLGVGKLYLKDSASIAQAVVVDKYLKEFCRLHNAYPQVEQLEKQFPELYPNQEWYYWPNEALSVATFQYPMTLPLPAAPGRAKVSEFFPIIYAYSVYDPCGGLLRVPTQQR
jgi:hypothetical protein